MVRSKNYLLAASIALMSFLPTVAHADAALSVDTGSLGVPASGSNHGWSFNVIQSILVTDLGLYDEGSDGFIADHEIGIFDATSGSLLVSGTVNAGTGNVLDGNFRYVDVANTWLNPGTDYVLGFYSAGSGEDQVIIDPVSVMFAPEVNYLESRWNVSGGFDMPGNSAGNDYRIGPNFRFSTIPEPASASLLAVGAFVVASRRRRR